MVNLFDIVRQAQGGSAMDNFGRQFGLSGDQTRLAVEAFLPALTLGLQRSAANPALFAQVLEMMTSGRYAPFFDGTARTRPGDGREVMERLFGSPEVIRQVTAQTATMTGIGAQVMQQLMPQVAAVVMGGLFRFASVDGIADYLRHWSDWLRTLKAPEAAPPQPASPFAAWTDLMGTLMGQRPVPRQAAPPPPTDPWSAFMLSLAGRAAPPPPPPPPSRPDPFATLAGMVETGRDVQAQHLASLQAIFDGLRDATAKR
jgi:hypothetical protein